MCILGVLLVMQQLGIFGFLVITFINFFRAIFKGCLWFMKYRMEQNIVKIIFTNINTINMK